MSITSDDSLFADSIRGTECRNRPVWREAKCDVELGHYRLLSYIYSVYVILFAASVNAKPHLLCQTNVSYGPTAGQRMDIFRNENTSPG